MKLVFHFPRAYGAILCSLHKHSGASQTVAEEHKRSSFNDPFWEKHWSGSRGNFLSSKARTSVSSSLLCQFGAGSLAAMDRSPLSLFLFCILIEYRFGNAILLGTVISVALASCQWSKEEMEELSDYCQTIREDGGAVINWCFWNLAWIMTWFSCIVMLYSIVPSSSSCLFVYSTMLFV